MSDYPSSEHIGVSCLCGTHGCRGEKCNPTAFKLANTAKAPATSNGESNRDKVLRGEVVKVTDDRLREMQRICVANEGVGYESFHWHWAAAVSELIERRAVETTAHFQGRVHQWMKDCFKRPDALFLEQRAFRFIEEALELAQAAGTSREDVLRLVQYVYDRPVGVISQEIGGVMVTLAALATSCYYIMDECGETELSRCVKNTDRIRAKDLVKPQRSPLPGLSEEPTARKATYRDIFPDDPRWFKEGMSGPWFELPSTLPEKASDSEDGAHKYRPVSDDNSDCAVCGMYFLRCSALNGSDKQENI